MDNKAFEKSFELSYKKTQNSFDNNSDVGLQSMSIKSDIDKCSNDKDILKVSNSSLSTNEINDDRFNYIIDDNNDDDSLIIGPKLLNNSLYDDEELTNIEDEICLINKFDNQFIERVCLYEISLLDILYTKNYKDIKKNNIFHQLTKYKEIKHKVSNITVQIFDKNLNLDDEGFIKFDTYLFAEALISRLKKEENILRKFNLIESMINEPNINNETPFMISLQEDRLDLLKLYYPYAKLYFFKKPFNHSPLHLTCIKSSYNCFKFLMEEHYLKSENISEINFHDCYGNSALGLAIKFYSVKKSNESIKIIQELIECKNIYLKTKNKEGNSLAHLVCKLTNCSPKVKLNILKLLNVKLSDMLGNCNNLGQNTYDCWKEDINCKKYSFNEVIKFINN